MLARPQVPKADLLKVTKCEAQVWLLVYHLTCDEECRKNYGLNVFRKEQLLRLRKYLNDVVLDQLPVLADVMRYMDELALMSVPENSTGQGGALMMQQVAGVRDEMTRNKDWKAVKKTQWTEIWSKTTDAKVRHERASEASANTNSYLYTFFCARALARRTRTSGTSRPSTTRRASRT